MSTTTQANGQSGAKRPAEGATKQPEGGRDARGRFQAGHRGGPGNPFARRVAELRRALLAAVTDDDIKYMAGVLVQMARGGDLAAVKLLFSYVIGKPVEVSDPDRLDLEEWRLRQEAGVSAEQMTGVLDKMPADMANRLTAASHPYLVEQNFAGPFLRELEEFSGNDQLPLPKRCNGEAGVERQAAEAIVLPPASSTIIDNVGQRSVLGGKRQRRAGRAR